MSLISASNMLSCKHTKVLFDCRFNGIFTSMCQMRRCISYQTMEQIRMRQARKSVLIRHELPKRTDLLVRFCEKFGPVSEAYSFYKQGPNNGDSMHFTLIEYNKNNSVDSLMKQTAHFPSCVIPVRSRTLYFQKNDIYGIPSLNNGKYVNQSAQMKKKMKTQQRSDLRDEHLINAKSLSQQMQLIYDHLKMDELDIRLRYFICASLEESLHGILHKSSVRPFGSSVSGFGTYNNDLDMALDYQQEKSKEIKDRLLFLSKGRNRDTRHLSQESLDTIAGIMRNFLPLYQKVILIPNARVPIIKFIHGSVNLECDLTVENRSGITMAEFLHTLSQLDRRIPVLVFSIRIWARQFGITTPQPTGMSNFMMLMLITNFLQVQSVPVIPSVAEIVGEPNLNLITEEKCAAFTRRCEKYSSANSTTVDQLIKDFFEFYTTFDFTKDAISIIQGKSFPNPDPENTAMFIPNPVEEGHNVCRNLREVHVKHFQDGCKTALDSLNNSNIKDLNSKREPWGLLSIINATNLQIQRLEGVNEDLNGVSKINLQNLMEDNVEDDDDLLGDNKNESSFLENETKTGELLGDNVDFLQTKHSSISVSELFIDNDNNKL